MLEQIESRKSMSWNASVELLVSVPHCGLSGERYGGNGSSSSVAPWYGTVNPWLSFFLGIPLCSSRGCPRREFAVNW